MVSVPDQYGGRESSSYEKGFPGTRLLGSSLLRNKVLVFYRSMLVVRSARSFQNMVSFALLGILTLQYYLHKTSGAWGLGLLCLLACFTMGTFASGTVLGCFACVLRKAFARGSSCFVRE